MLESEVERYIFVHGPSRVPFIEMLEYRLLYDCRCGSPSRVPFIEMLEFDIGAYEQISCPSRVPFIEMLEYPLPKKPL